MTARPYIVRCTARGCQSPAEFKIAAEWSDGAIQELKTYALACAEHLEGEFRRSCDRQVRRHRAEGESLSSPQIFRLAPGQRDRELERLADLEQRFSSGANQ